MEIVATWMTQRKIEIVMQLKFQEHWWSDSSDKSRYLGDDQPDFEPSSTIEKDNYNVTRIIMGSHSSTHVDAQKHFMM
jgi:hypothetical protein